VSTLTESSMELGIPRVGSRLRPQTRVDQHFPAKPVTDAVVIVSSHEGLRRALNLSIATGALIAVSPLMLLIAVVVKCTSRGPIIYSQTRVGLDRRGRSAASRNLRRSNDLGGRPFRIYKFRTMCVNAEQLTGAVWATRGDPRVTLVGRFLRQYRLDELPQLFNVIKGDMNIVGPRPERPTIFADLRTKVADYAVRQRARPGITGLAQISQQYDSSLDDVRNKVRHDVEYLRRQSLGEDLRIMLKTIPVVLFRRGGW